MSVNSNCDYEALAKLLYPSIEASGNVYYGQTRKLTMDEVFDKYKGGFESHIESRRVEDISSEYGFKYEKYFCWTIGPLSGEFCIDGDGDHHIQMEIYPLYYAKYLLNKTIVAEENVLNSGSYNSYHYDIEPKLKKVFYHGGKNPCDDNPWDGKSFYIVKDGDDYYLYVAIINGVSDNAELLPEEYDPDNPLCFVASNDVGFSLSLKLESFGNVTHKDIYEYSYDKATWSDFNIDSTIVPIGPSVGQNYLRVYVRFKNGAEKDVYNNLTTYVRFITDSVQGQGHIDVHGDIRSIQQDANELQPYEFSNLFSKFKELIKLPDLPCKTLAEGCYTFMFAQCINVIDPPRLYAERMVDDCYTAMFSRCTKLRSTPLLNSTRLANNCYNGMFIGCTSLSKASVLPAESVPINAYSTMFSQCTSLKYGPYIFGSDIKNRACLSMFTASSNLQHVYCPVGNLTSGTDSFMVWLPNSSSVLHTSADAEWSATDTTIIPSGCTIVRDFELEYTYDD